MDATALAAIISALAGGAAGEAGKSAWNSLTALVRRRFGDDSAELERRPPDEAAAGLVWRAGADPEFGEALAEWMRDASALVQQRRDVTNTISGDARVTGPVIQAGDIHGSINLGGPH
ncbi:hypothetical protein [Bailinhaonella thermotolerans]|uniref:Uncharacterized protein n=1 Tax=Bailinhaonella thermotolerans TaxID=1070861 RepID=A0A3A4B0N1_9ACTN|nr:hypothetical protein [Bailinhaonella thermotolerans]RJL31000.1 hypothetical protein D5H75_22235 [Bailinhaonella thermotolerans]